MREDCHAEAKRRRASRCKDRSGGTSVKYVYILQSTEWPEHYYTGVTDDLRARLARHNAGEVTHTSKFKPWRLNTYVAFSDEKRAFAFERYLKTSSGRAFARKRL
jgi:predicted GIY-YIG superfamily endonuclease